MTEEKNTSKKPDTCNNNNNHPNLSWSEQEMPQKKRTKHVHGLHPYLGKYVPQLVEYFLKTYFKPGDTVLDPFVGSGTSVVESNILGINSLGVDISVFNILLCKVKTAEYDFNILTNEIRDITRRIKEFSESTKKKVNDSDKKQIKEFGEKTKFIGKKL